MFPSLNILSSKKLKLNNPISHSSPRAAPASHRERSNKKEQPQEQHLPKLTRPRSNSVPSFPLISSEDVLSEESHSADELSSRSSNPPSWSPVRFEYWIDNLEEILRSTPQRVRLLIVGEDLSNSPLVTYLASNQDYHGKILLR